MNYSHKYNVHTYVCAQENGNKNLREMPMSHQKTQRRKYFQMQETNNKFFFFRFERLIFKLAIVGITKKRYKIVEVYI